MFDGWVTNNDIQVTNFNNITDILTVEAKYTLSTHIDNTSVSRICIYPNPVSDGNLHIKTNDEIHGATIMDISGKVVYVISNTAPTQSIDVKGWKSGMYFIRIANRIHKFIVK